MFVDHNEKSQAVDNIDDVRLRVCGSPQARDYPDAQPIFFNLYGQSDACYNPVPDVYRAWHLRCTLCTHCGRLLCAAIVSDTHSITDMARHGLDGWGTQTLRASISSLCSERCSGLGIRPQKGTKVSRKRNFLSDLQGFTFGSSRLQEFGQMGSR